jgi:hypothetical protein
MLVEIFQKESNQDMLDLSHSHSTPFFLHSHGSSSTDTEKIQDHHCGKTNPGLSTQVRLSRTGKTLNEDSSLTCSPLEKQCKPSVNTSFCTQTTKCFDFAGYKVEYSETIEETTEEWEEWEEEQWVEEWVEEDTDTKLKILD